MRISSILLLTLAPTLALSTDMDGFQILQGGPGSKAITTQTDAQAGDARSIKDVLLSPLDALTRLVDSSTSTDEEFLPADKAFQLSVTPQDANTLAARWKIADGYYLYRDKMRFSLKDASGVRLRAVSLPQGRIEQDEFFGKTQIYPWDISVLLPLARTGGDTKSVTFRVQYQGCAEAGICYPPITKEVHLTLPASKASASNRSSWSGAHDTSGNIQSARNAPSRPFQSEQDRIEERLATGGIWLNMLAFFGAGLLLAFTPCVLPMIPILSGMIVGQGAATDARKALLLSLVFVLAMAATYTIAGIIVGLSGENVQASFQNPWVISIFAGVFVLLALSMFGFYKLQMPPGIQTRLAALSRRQQGGTFIGAGIMGFLSALIVGPCVTAPLIGALLYIAHTGNAMLGGAALFALALGMGIPVLAVGTAAGKLIPKAGPWMNIIQSIFGVVFLGVAIFLLERILPVAITMALWALLLIVTGIYLGAFDALRAGRFRSWKGLGLGLSIYGVLLLIGAASGGHDLLRPLKGVLMAEGQQDHTHLEFSQVKGLDGLQQALMAATAQGKPVMLDFYADWCVSCKEMERYTFSDPAVQAVLRKAMLLQTDVTANDAADRALLKSLGLFGPPAILFYTPHGQELRQWRVMGYMPADEFSRHVEQALQFGSAS
ncbi:MAG TPA: protein-disulfide reductase DsbD [Gammaproteobacteria bacterium]|nr:protein-disulfide reductase DsbD [Gammaproteobacteria bacterium]